MPASLLLPVSLWALIDAYIVSLVQAWSAVYIEVENGEVIVAEQFDPDHVELPFKLVRSYERSLKEADHLFGDGVFHMSGMVYGYEIVVMAAFEQMADAKTFAANASASLIDELRKDPTMGGLQAASGEYVTDFDFDDGEIFVRGVAAQAPDQGRYVGTAVIRISVNTEI